MRTLAPFPIRDRLRFCSLLNPSQLPVALSQHEKPVVVENTLVNAWLTYWFKQLLRLEGNDQLLRIAWFIVRFITQAYNLEDNWHAKWIWDEVGGKITLSPRTMTPPAGEE